MTTRLRLCEYRDVEDDHVIVHLRVCLACARGEISGKVREIADVISFGGPGAYSAERRGAREEHGVKVVRMEPDAVGHSADNEHIQLSLALPVSMIGGDAEIPQLLAVAMYASVLDFVREYQILDMDLPGRVVQSKPGPRFGSGLFGEEAGNRPAIGVILKPRVLVNARLVKEIVAPLVEAGADYVIDDELTVDPWEWRFFDRVPFVARLVESYSRGRARYITHVTGTHSTALERARTAAAMGAGGVMLNVLTMGFDAIEELAGDDSFGLPIVANVIGRSIMCAGPQYRIAEPLYCLLARVAGADAAYAAPFLGNIQARREQASTYARALNGRIGGIKELRGAYAVMSGGVTPKNVFENWELYGAPLMIQMGSSLCQAVERGVPAKDIFALIHMMRSILELEAEERREEVIRRLAAEPALARSAKVLGW